MINGLFGMSKTQGKTSGGKGESQGAGESMEREFAEEEIEASGDSAIIADAIYAGLTEIAGAIRSVAKALDGGVEEESYEAEAETYLDGRRK